ncbi:hypothetical protein DKP76_18305 [Falsochrobactrum shanghaiense]|uniref:Transposase n=2 Tax=Falsochrobactrum shanghaiense TaxID=2201899 RepID=A0A316J636_9HYPH|nr:hypothetical protein DKP76_18305 [Falsochrobactrum shanghaiense]
MNEDMNHSQIFEVLTAEPVRSRRRPRDWSDDEKARIAAVSLQAGANVSAIARSEDLDPSQLYGWRRKAFASGVASPATAGTNSLCSERKPAH